MITTVGVLVEEALAVGLSVEEALSDIGMKAIKVVIHMECDYEAS